MALFGIGKKKKESEAQPAEKEAKKAPAKKATESKQEKEKTEAKKAPVEKKVSTKNIGLHEDISRVLLQPRITEKATIGIERGAYVFNVAPESNKKQIAQAVERVYNVTPVKIRVTNIPSKNVRSQRTGVKGVKSGGKKAYVYLKKGDTISIM